VGVQLTWTAPLAAVAGELMNTQLWDPLADDLMLLGYKPMGEMTGGTQTIAFSTFARLDAVNTILDQDPSGLSLARTSDFTTAQFQGELFHEYTIRTAGWYIFEGQIQLTTDTVTAGGRQVNLYYNNGAFFTSIRTNQTVPWTLGWTWPPSSRRRARPAVLSPSAPTRRRRCSAPSPGSPSSRWRPIRPSFA
jgi:hypothetical protein